MAQWISSSTQRWQAAQPDRRPESHHTGGVDGRPGLCPATTQAKRSDGRAARRGPRLAPSQPTDQNRPVEQPDLHVFVQLCAGPRHAGPHPPLLLHARRQPLRAPEEPVGGHRKRQGLPARI